MDNENMTWDMFVTDEKGKRMYAGNCDKEAGANAFLKMLVEECGYSGPEKRHICKGNHGYYMLDKTPWPLPHKITTKHDGKENG